MPGRQRGDPWPSPGRQVAAYGDAELPLSRGFSNLFGCSDVGSGPVGLHPEPG